MGKSPLREDLETSKNSKKAHMVYLDLMLGILSVLLGTLERIGKRGMGLLLKGTLLMRLVIQSVG